MDDVITTIHVKKDETRCDEGWIRCYIDVLNGVIARMQNGYYRQPFRNELMLNAYVSSYMLGLDIYAVLELVGFDDLEAADDEHIDDRLSRMSNYEDRFGWSYMIDPAFYQNLGDQLTKGHSRDMYYTNTSIRCVLD